ncbi:MAG: CPBP family intramembrane metalloprotease [Porphyromonadaceae bacterium]|nr:CPBP family intramembrane metalloprotease [Porphyromonadaceae bacterium]
MDLLIDTLVIAPLLETLVFQTLFYLFFKHVNINRWIIITLSAVAFGCYHNYSVFLMINTFLIGLIFMYMYLKRAEINNSPYISTVSAHFTSNFFVTLHIFVTRFFA